MKRKLYRIITFAPQDQSQTIRTKAVEAGADHSGTFRYNSFAVSGVGTFISTDGAHAVTGVMRENSQEEVRLEFICSGSHIRAIVDAIESVHPDEDPVIDLYPLQTL